MKRIEVVAAILKEQDKILATKRGYGEFVNFWEFPGGKIEPGESKEEALRREILEELDIEISIDLFLTSVEYDYPTFHLVMHCYICSVSNGTIRLLEHKDAKWLSLKDLDSVEWLPADVEVVEKLKGVVL